MIRLVLVRALVFGHGLVLVLVLNLVLDLPSLVWPRLAVWERVRTRT